MKLVLQNPEAESVKSLEGRFLGAVRKDPSLQQRELTKLRSLVTDDMDANDVRLPESTSCVTGFSSTW